MQRRNFLMGLGAVGIGAASSIGTGAFTNATIPDRQVTAVVDADDQSTISLVPGSDPDIFLSTNPGELTMDLSGTNGEGSNINSVYTWGDHNDPSNDYAFKLVNNDEQEYDDLVLTYELDDDSWVDNATTNDSESFIRFDAYGQGQPDGYWGFMKCPNNQLSVPNPVTRNMPTSDPVDLGVGQEIYFVIDIDTTGGLATLDDDLSGKLTFEVSGPGGN